jgi:hypothetical protein
MPTVNRLAFGISAAVKGRHPDDRRRVFNLVRFPVLAGAKRQVRAECRRPRIGPEQNHEFLLSVTAMPSISLIYNPEETLLNYQASFSRGGAPLGRAGAETDGRDAAGVPSRLVLTCWWEGLS